MEAAVFTDVKKVEILEIDKPKVKPNEVLVKIEAAAICTWEQRAFQGINKVNYPFIGGHEQSGTIVAVGSDINTDIWNVGDRVVVGLLMSCGECYYCKIGEEGSCENFQYEKFVGGLNVKGMGGYAQYLSVTTDKLFKIPDGVSFEEAALTEPLSCALHSVELAEIKMGQNVVVIGAGIMGVFHALLAKHQGARVIVSEPDKKRRDFLRDLGFKELINPMEEDLVKVVKELTEGRGADIIFNTTAISAIAQESLDMVALYGKIILYSSFYPDTPLSVSPPTFIHKSMVSLMGSVDANSSDFITSLKLMAAGVIDVNRVISEVGSFYNMEDAIEKAISPDTYRVVVKWEKQR